MKKITLIILLAGSSTSMKHLILFVTIILFSFNLVAQGYKGLKFGMTKKEVKNEFKINKKDYATVEMGGWLFRTYKQNYLYTNDGKLQYIKFQLKGALYGVNEASARNVYKGVVNMFKSLDYLTDEPTEFIINNTLTMRNKEKGVMIFIAIIPSSGDKLYVNIGLMPYKAKKKTDKNKDF